MTCERPDATCRDPITCAHLAYCCRLNREKCPACCGWGYIQHLNNKCCARCAGRGFIEKLGRQETPS